MSKNLLCVVFVLFSAVRAFSWTDGELLVWISVGLAELANKFEKDLGIPVKVETPDGLTDKFQSAAQSGKGPDIVVWAHDRLGEWADVGLLKPLEIGEDFKEAFLPMAWDAVTHNNQIWGYPLTLEAISLIYDKKIVTGTSPTQLSEIPAFAKELKAKHPNVIPIMWDYNTPYFSWPFLASDGGVSLQESRGWL